jgi:hypothetical protein
VTQYTSAKSDKDFRENKGASFFGGVNKERIKTISTQNTTFMFVKKKEI